MTKRKRKLTAQDGIELKGVNIEVPPKKSKRKLFQQALPQQTADNTSAPSRALSKQVEAEKYKRSKPIPHLTLDSLNPIERFGLSMMIDEDKSNKMFDVYNKLVDYKNQHLANPKSEMSDEERQYREKLAQTFKMGYPADPTQLYKYIEALESNKPRNTKVHPSTDSLAAELSRQYFGINDNPQLIEKSRYAPTHASKVGAQYFDFGKRVKDQIISDYSYDILQKAAAGQQPVSGYSFNARSNQGSGKNAYLPFLHLGKFKMSQGKDERGEYISYWDEWDLDPPVLRKRNIDIDKLNNPYEVYGRIYKDEFKKENTKSSDMKNKYAIGGEVPGDGEFLPPNPLDQEVLQWQQSYTASPKYNERLANFYKYPDYVQRQRSQQINQTSFNPIPANDIRGNALGYYPSDNTISVYPKGVQEVLNNYPNTTNKDLVRQQVVAHELGHSSNASNKNRALRLSPQEERYIFNMNKNVKPIVRDLALQHAEDVSPANMNKDPLKNEVDTISNFLGSGPTHDLSPGETKSDLDAARFLLNKKGIYDARTQDFNADVLKKARMNKDIQQSPIFQRLQQNYDDKGIIDLLNKVAVNNSINDALPIAKDGIHIKKENRGKFTASAHKAGMSVQDFASHVLKNKGKYSSTQVKRANFARNASKWHKAEFGVDIPYMGMGPQDPELQRAKGRITDYFQNDPYQGYVPNDASLEGPDPYQEQYMTNDQGDVVPSDYTPLGQEDPGIAPSGAGGNFDIPSFTINAGAAITGLAGIVTKAAKRSQAVDEFSRLKRRNATMQTYNPNAYGTGSQALMRNGGYVNNKFYEFTPEQAKFLKKQGYKL